MCHRFGPPNHLFLFLHQDTAGAAIRRAAVAASGALDAELFAHVAALDCLEDPLQTAEREREPACALFVVRLYNYLE